MSDEAVVSIARFEAGSSGEMSGTLKAPYVTDLPSTGGYAIPVAKVTSLTLTLTNAATGAVVNSRDAQDVLDANNVDVNSQGALLWSVQAADTALAVATAKSEEHIASFVCVYDMDDGKGEQVLRFTWRLFCSKVTGLCLFDDVRLGAKGIDDSERLFVERRIDAFSARVEAETGRRLDYVTGATEVLTPLGGWEVRVPCFPIVSVASVKESDDGDFASADALDPAEYAIDSNGLIRMRYRPFLYGVRSVQVVYTGGFARETGAVRPDVRTAAADQVTYEYQNKDSLGLVSESVNGVSVQRREPDWLPSVKRVIATLAVRSL